MKERDWFRIAAGKMFITLKPMKSLRFQKQKLNKNSESIQKLKVRILTLKSNMSLAVGKIFFCQY